MKFSLPLLTLVSLCIGNSQALSINRHALGQQPLELDLSIPQELLNKGKSFLDTVSEALGESTEGLTAEMKELWGEMEMKFPDAIQSMTVKSEPSFKITKKPTTFWDAHVQNDKLSNYKLRVKETNPGDLGIDHTKQYSGYLDVEDEDKHFFYWAFESRNDPKNDPVILWLNGGPGCSSLTGLFFELGSSSIGPDLKPIYNKYSWNSNATVVFLDQPVNVGFSYSSQSVSNTVAAGKDVYAFLELFYQQFPHLLKNDFHIAGESYGGHYIPVFASEILTHADRSFNLTSVLIGNGLTDPLTQYPYYERMVCSTDGGVEPILSEEECSGMEDSLPRCLSLIESCYNSESVFACVPAAIYCNNAEIGPFQQTGKNVYDVRKECKGSLCYEDMDYLVDYLNQDFVKEKLGAEVDNYVSCNFDVNRNFLFAGDWMKPYHKNVVNLLEQDVPVLIYAGDKDFICNWLGNEAWSNALPWSGHEEFEAAKTYGFHLEDGTKAGEVKNFDKFTFARLYDGGHMIPYDQPESSLTFVNRWIAGDYTLGTKK
ncbi:hypothetical protein OGAPHI_007152 [Ogataea philodendri]|uniref:Carboxypeptidase n=2 Tax=Saccharomycotina TaxID=147537 RepID=A0A9P8NWL3_9ASCO|nr:uncharacterized protein OGAPHI_007152 [Ogataea philodendri]KAH3660566.1 hypothetical protein OGAPHI_007152 [Ogataea philodendri]